MGSVMQITENATLFEARCQSKGNNLPPHLVVLCTWMGASSRHIAKYVEGYQLISKHSNVLVVEASLWDMTSRSQNAQRISLMPVVDIIQNHTTAVIMHAFSNGGAQTTTQILITLRERCEAGSIPATTILDSCPGVYTHWHTAQATVVGIPRKYLLRAAAFGGMYVWSVIYWTLLWISRTEDSISRTRRMLNDMSLISPAGPRLYLCSKADEIVDVKAVEDHLNDSLMAGYKNVQLAVFATASHCALVNEDRERYWKSIRLLLEGDEIGNGRSRSRL